MGSCISVKSKKREGNNKIIISNTLNKSQKRVNYNYQFFFSKPLQLIIKEIMKNSKSTDEITIAIEPDKTIKDLYNKLNININNEYDIMLKENQLISNININKKLIDLLYPYIKDNFQNSIYLTLLYKGLQIPNNIIESYIEKNPIIGSPIFDNPDYFGLITFNTKSKELKFFNYDQKNSEFSILSKFNSFTAYCNANGYLYISGGENEQSEDLEKSVVEYNDFLCIDLNQLNSNNNNNYTNADISDNDNILTNNLTNINEKNELNIKQLPNLLESPTWQHMIFVQ